MLTPSRWADLSSAEVALSCSEGTLIHRGALNHGYRASLRGEIVFVRQRVVDDPEYGQLFGAEALVYPLLHVQIRGPRLHAITPSVAGSGPYAVFEYLPPGNADPAAVPALNELATRLAAVHSVRGRQIGGIGQPGPHRRLSDFYRGAIDQEAARLTEDVPVLTSTLRSERWRSHVDDVFLDEPVVLCHGDVHAGNWMPDEAGRLWLIDWEASRYRAAAADFNQLHWRWLSEAQESIVIQRYAEAVGRDQGRLRAQIVVARILWHLRTFNFYTRVRRDAPALHHEHLVHAATLSENALT